MEKGCPVYWSVSVEKSKILSWGQAPEVAQREVAPVNCVPLVKSRTMCPTTRITYRALKFCPFPSVALEDVVKTDVCTCELLAFGFTRAGYRAPFAITTTVALHCVAVEIVELSLEAVLSAHKA